MDEIAEIIEVRDKELKISLRRTSACDSCASVNLCRPGGKQYLTIDRPADLEVGPGDTVKVVISDRAFLWTVLLVYGLPTLGFIITVGIIESLTGDSLIALLSGLAALAISLALVIWIDRIVKRNRALDISVVEVLKKKF